MRSLVMAPRSLDERFVALAQRVIEAGCTATGLGPEDVWNQLVADSFSSWRYAESLRDRLSVPREHLLDVVTGRKRTTTTQWIALRHETEDELATLLAEVTAL